MFSHLELGSDPPIGLDRESGCDIFSRLKVNRRATPIGDVNL